MKGATKSEVLSVLWMAMVLGASSPKTTCKNVIIPKAMANATGWRTPSGIPSRSNSGSITVATAGSPSQPRPREEIVMPSWQTARYASSLPVASLTIPAPALPSRSSRSTCVDRIFTRANSAATNRPFRTTRNSAARILSAERITPSRMAPQEEVLGSAPRTGARRYSMARRVPYGQNIPTTALWQTPSLIEQTLVQDVGEGFPGQIPAQVLAEEIRLTLVDQDRHHVRGVRADNDVLELPQGALLRQRFDFEYIQRRAGELPASQRVDERLLIHHRPPPDVHEVSPRLHCACGPGVHEVPGLRGARQRDGHVVCLAQSVVQTVRGVELVGVAPRGVVLAHRPLDPDDARPEGPYPLGDGAPDVAHTDDAERLALQGVGMGLAPDLLRFITPQPVEVLGVLEQGHDDELGQGHRVDAARDRHHDVRLQEAGLLRHLPGAGHARLHPAEVRGDLREVPHVSPGEVVENLGFLEHREELLLFLLRAAPVFGSGVIPRPPGRRDEILPVQHPQAPVHLPDAEDVLLLEVAPYDHRDQSASFVGSLSAFQHACFAGLSARRFAPCQHAARLRQAACQHATPCGLRLAAG